MIQIAGRSVDMNADRVTTSGVVTRQDLAALAAMPNLRALNLNGADITDDDLELVGRLTTLQDLDLSATGVTDAGVCHLRALTRMRHLRIKETSITDVGIGHLAPMVGLESINVRDLDITGAGLLLLAKHPHLGMLVVSDGLNEGRFSYAVLAKVQRQLPTCEITVVGRGIFPDI